MTHHGELDIRTDVDISYIDVFERVVSWVAPHEIWKTATEEFWCYTQPPGHAYRAQGWKIHVSATPLSAETVLERVTEILVRHRCAFKFAKGFAQLQDLLAMRCDRSAGGKFITIYPNDDSHFRRIIHELHVATEGLDGPAILSDRPYVPGSLVHYRYGGFSADRSVLDLDGSYAPMLVAPDGTWTKDERLAWFSPPAWAHSPLPDTPARKPEAELAKPVLLDGRFLVEEAIRHANRGGVYRALDQQTGDRVIIKQVRPHVAADLYGGDARDWIRHEAKMLDLLEPLGLAPRKVSLFVYEEHVFLAEELLEGISLRQWVDNHVRNSADARPEAEDVASVLRQLIGIMEKVHDQGLVLRDFNPGNVMIDPAGRLRLIDTEFLAVPGERVVNGHTPGYASPEQVGGGTHIHAPDRTADLYALGASLLFLCSGVHPALPGDQPADRSLAMRVLALAEAIADTNPLVRHYMPALVGLLADDPERRWSLGELRTFLGGLDMRAFSDEQADTSSRSSEPDSKRMLEDGLRAMARGATPDRPYLYPPVRMEGRLGDPCSVQSGAAGPVEVFRRALEVDHDEEIAEAFMASAHWLDRRLGEEGRILPGLYFGRSGSAWALYEAAIALGDTAMEQRALDFAQRIPVRWDNPDLTHGLAGAGTTQLHLWLRTGEERFRERALLCAEELVKACERREESVAWPIPATFRSDLAGLSHYGFAHGVAGVSTFLIAVSRILDRPDLLELAIAGGEVMLAVAQPYGDGLRWPTGDNNSGQDEGVTWWCSGSGGVGAFLIRLWRATGDDRFREYAHGAAMAVVQDKWQQATVHCHGLAGSGELLLDMAAATGDRQYLDHAAEISACLYARHTIRDGLVIITGEDPQSITYSYNLGLAGTVGFLHRTRHGGPRWWTVDDFALPTADLLQVDGQR